MSVLDCDPPHLLQPLQVEAIDAVVILVMVDAVVQAVEALAVIVRPADGSVVAIGPQGFRVWRWLRECEGRSREATATGQRLAPSEHELLGDMPVVRAFLVYRVIHILFQERCTLVAFMTDGRHNSSAAKAKMFTT